MQDVVQRQAALEQDLRGAIEREEFFLVYQPTFDLRGMVPTGVEALIRWRSPTRGLVQPNDFIPQLEQSGLIVPVGRWVLERACEQGAQWREGRPPHRRRGQRVGPPARRRRVRRRGRARARDQRYRPPRADARDHRDGADAKRPGGPRSAWA